MNSYRTSAVPSNKTEEVVQAKSQSSVADTSPNSSQDSSRSLTHRKHTYAPNGAAPVPASNRKAERLQRQAALRVLMKAEPTDQYINTEYEKSVQDVEANAGCFTMKHDPAYKVRTGEAVDGVTKLQQIHELGQKVLQVKTVFNDEVSQLIESKSIVMSKALNAYGLVTRIDAVLSKLDFSQSKEHETTFKGLDISYDERIADVANATVPKLLTTLVYSQNLMLGVQFKALIALHLQSVDATDSSRKVKAALEIEKARLLEVRLLD